MLGFERALLPSHYVNLLPVYNLMLCSTVCRCLCFRVLVGISSPEPTYYHLFLSSS